LQKKIFTERDVLCHPRKKTCHRRGTMKTRTAHGLEEVNVRVCRL